MSSSRSGRGTARPGTWRSVFLPAVTVALIAVSITGCVPAAPTPELPSTRGSVAPGATAQNPEVTEVRIRLTNDRTEVTVALQDTSAARQLVSQLPISVEFRDFAGNERIADLASPLTVDDEPDGTDAQAGDLAYYAPWGNLAFFYRPAPYAEGLVRLGALEPGAGEVTDLTGRFTVELVE